MQKGTFYNAKGALLRLRCDFSYIISCIECNRMRIYSTVLYQFKTDKPICIGFLSGLNLYLPCMTPDSLSEFVMRFVALDFCLP